MAAQNPTFSESWYRVMGLKARLRPSAQVARQHYRGERWYVLRDPAGTQFLRVNAAAYRFVGLLDGTRTVGQAWELVGGQMADEAPTQPEVIQILSQLHAANLLEANIAADAGVLLKRHKQLQQRQLQGRLMNVLFPRVRFWDPDRFLKRWLPVMNVVLGRLGALVWLCAVIGAIAVLAPRWTALKQAAAHAIDFHANKENYVWLIVTFVVIKLIHELGHGFMCRRYGGEVHEMGLMLLVFVPAPYVDASSAWVLPSRWHRALIGLGGMIFELFVASLLAFVWASTSPQLLINQLAYNAMLIASVSTVIFNANPLLRYDGYYILSDLLEIPNLGQRSTDYAMGLIKRHAFGVKSPTALPPLGQRAWLLVYAITSSAYRVFVGVMIILIVQQQVPVLGVLMALGGVVTWIFVPLGKATKYLLLEPELHRHRGRAIGLSAAAVAAVVVVIGVIPMAAHVRAAGIVAPKVQVPLRAAYDGFVRRVAVRDGQWVHQGDLILVMESDELTRRVQELEAQVQTLQRRIKEARVSDAAQEEIFTRDMDAAQKELEQARLREQEMRVKAPIDGLVIGPDLEQMVGKYKQTGDDLATVAQLDNFVVRVVLEQHDVALVQAGITGDPEVRLAGAMSEDRELAGHLDRQELGVITSLPYAALGTKGGGDLEVDPQDADGKRLVVPQHMLTIDLKDTSWAYVPGQRAYVRFTLPRQPLLSQWTRDFWQLLQTENSRNKWL